jgi:hypothetical protein
LHIVAIVLGSFAISAAVVAVGVAMGFSGGAAFGLGVASFALAQGLYLVFVAAMARAERLRRQSARPDVSAPAKPGQSVVQKS